MSGYRTFAIWGAGNIGSRLAAHLLDFRPEKVSEVIVLTRPESQDHPHNRALADRGAIIRPFDVQDAHADACLRGVDVLVASPAFGALFLQHDLLHAAVRAGVRLFVPGEWGDTTDGRAEPIFVIKQAVRAEARALGVPTAAFFTGVWVESLWDLGFDLKRGKITINGAGDATISMTSINDVVRFAVHVLLELPRSQLENATFTLEGDKITLNRLAASLQLVSSKLLTVKHVPRRRLERRLRKNPDDIMTSVFMGWDSGSGEHPNELSNHLWPEWKPRKAIETMTVFVERL